jgi:formate hydrogenlyase subunit 3/multisubunit Na+/H+ antiporter MnhD subunit
MGAPTQRRALGALFVVLALALGGIAVASGFAGRWVIAAAAAAIAVWLGTLALQGLRPR